MNTSACIDLFIAIQQAGITIVDDITECEKLLRQTFASRKREMNLLITALRERIPQQMNLLIDLYADEAILHKWAKQLEEHHGIRGDASIWAVESWGVALGKTLYPTSFLNGVWNAEFLERSVIESGVSILLSHLNTIRNNLIAQNSEEPDSYMLICYNNRLSAFERITTLLGGWNPKQDPAYFLQVIHNNFKGQDLDGMGQDAKLLLDKRQLPYFSLKKSIFAHRDHVSAIAISQDGKRIYSASWDKTIKIFEYPNFKNVGSLVGHMDRINTLAICPDDITCISGSADGDLIVWDLLDTGSSRVISSAHQASINGLQISPDGNWLVTCATDGEINIWNPNKMEKVYSLNSEAGRNTAIAITPDSHRFLTISSKDSVKLWELESGRLRNTFTQGKQAVGLSIHPDGKYLFIAYVDGTISLWDITSKIMLHSWQAQSTRVISIAVNSTGSVLGSLDASGLFKTWDVQNGEFIAQVETAAQIKFFIPFKHQSGWVTGNAGGGISCYELIDLLRFPLMSPAGSDGSSIMM